MTLPRLDSFDESIGDSLASLTDTIGQLVKPTAKYDQALKQIFIEKPELMQKFVDVEKQNPGTLKAFGFSDGATDFLSGMKESIPSVRLGLGRELLGQDKSTQRTAAQQEATGETPEQATGAKLREFMLNGGMDLLHSDPQAFDAAIRKTLGVGTRGELRTQADEEKVYQRGTELKDMGIPELITGLLSGSISNEQLNAGLMHPAASAGLKAALSGYAYEREANLRKELARTAAQGRFASTSNALEIALRRAAYDQFKASGGVAPIGAFYERMWGQPYGGTNATPDQLKAVDDWLKTSTAQADVARKQKLFTSLKPLYEMTVRKKNQPPPSIESVQNAARQMNDLLSSSGSEWRAEVDVTNHWIRPDEGKIIFRDNKGNISKDPTPVFSNVPSPDTIRASDNPPPLNQNERQLMTQFLNMDPNQWDAAIQQMRDSNVPEDVIQRIIDNLPAY